MASFAYGFKVMQTKAYLQGSTSDGGNPQNTAIAIIAGAVGLAAISLGLVASKGALTGQPACLAVFRALSFHCGNIFRKHFWGHVSVVFCAGFQKDNDFGRASLAFPLVMTLQYGSFRAHWNKQRLDLPAESAFCLLWAAFGRA